MISFDDRRGPADAAPASAYPPLTVPDWYRDAKLGLFVHWGLYSVPGWADVLDRRDVTAQNAYARHQYAEWYANTVRIEGSPTRARHREIYGADHDYEDFAQDWGPAAGAVEGIVALAQRAGARYLVPTTKHHDGFCLWDSATTRFSSAQRDAGRDLVAEFAAAARTAGLRFGVYYSGALDWHVTDFPPLRSNEDLFSLRRNDAEFAALASAQLRELIDRFTPDLLWNDIDWPDAGKYDGPESLQQIFRDYLAAVPEGMVNDRWGVPAHGVLTREYQDIDAVQPEVFESTRGLGLSFGCNAAESPEHALDGPGLIRLLVDVVSKNGNLLINVGPRADGSIPELQASALEQLGRWSDRHGAAVFGTRPWMHQAVTVPPGGVRFTRGAAADGSEVLNVFLLDPAAGPIELTDEVSAAIREIAVTTSEKPLIPAPGEAAVDLSAARVLVTPEAASGEVAVAGIPLR